ncbi:MULTISPECIES: tripartite tricarboxylate transporter TctB family protein [unclassified Roseovarius]|uniref:tripartite tricarboxylate transporter TctB family protein n=1 Tax=unclassified Roseovarius TaxID=2614913 RepID=UPI00273F8411|nr:MULTISPECIES: tripartite tricarboxylate transporter TctB family protein [unclassified Roseovarius]
MAEAANNEEVLGSSDLSTFNIAASVCLATLSLFALAYLIPVHVAVRDGSGQGLSAQFMPRLSAIAVLVLSLSLLAGVVLRRVRGLEAIAEDNEDNEIQGFGQREISNTVLLALGCAGHVVLLQYVGFVIATSLTLAACMWFGGFRKPVWLLILCVGFPIALKQILWSALYITVPTGMF